MATGRTGRLAQGANAREVLLPVTTEVPSEFPVSCEHAHACPGCPWIAAPYGEQLQRKAARVDEALRGFSELAGLGVAPVSAAPRLEGYRTRAKLVVQGRALGLYARGDHAVIDLPGCRVLAPALSRVAQTVRALLPVDGLEGVDLALADAQVLVTWIAREGVAGERFLEATEALCARHPEVVSVAVSFRERGAVQLLGTGHSLLRGMPEVRASVPGSHAYQLTTFGAFQQAHRDTAAAIWERIGALLSHGRESPLRVLELYAGSGALALSLAAKGAHVVAVESYEPSCERLARAAAEQRLSVEVRAGDAADVATQLAAQGARFDAVVVNPPRRGLDLRVRRALAALAPSKLVYVSCNPETLARDLAHLAREGLSPAHVQPFDMMPLTDQVETLVLLEPGAPPSVEVLLEAGPLLAVNKPPHEPTTPQGEHARSLLARVQAHPGFPRAVPLHRLDMGTSGVCLFARTPEDAGALARALGEGDKHYLALAKGITHKRGRIQRPIVEGGRSLHALTRYERLEVCGGHSLLRVYLETGRKHQIRRHLAGVGHPLIGDERYGDRATQRHFAMRHGLDRPFLHCESVALTYDGKRLEIRAPLAPDLVRVLESVRAAASVKAVPGRR